MKTQFKFTLDLPSEQMQMKYLLPLEKKLIGQIKENYLDFRKVDWHMASDIAISRYLKSTVVLKQFLYTRTSSIASFLRGKEDMGYKFQLFSSFCYTNRSNFR